MSLFVAGLGRASSKKGRVVTFIGDMDVSKFKVYMQKVEEEKLREAYKSRKLRLVMSRGSRRMVSNRSQFKKQMGPAPSLSSARAPRNKVAPPNKDAHRGATSITGGGENRIYAITRLQEQENHLDVVIGKIKVYAFDIYSSLDPGAHLSFVTPYVTNHFEVFPQKHSEPFDISTSVRESILAEIVYPDCPIFINQKNTITDLVKFEIVDFDVILDIDWLHSCYASIDCRTRVVTF
ncbi:uncharacterized protein [Solanum lycopersicum]|uniref:uncharacterized protein n=1 Tax=Solanum lycopersicum TaxID=4081 RepID=UPI00374A6CCF